MTTVYAVQEFFELLRPLVELESPTRDFERNRGVADLLEGLLTTRGAAVERLTAPGFGDHLIGRIEPDAHNPPLLILGHMDTVHPVGSLEAMPLRLLDDRITGPGVFDMKGGLCVALLALDAVRARGAAANAPQREQTSPAEGALPGSDTLPPGGVTFLITCDEEIGSPSSRELIEREARASRATLVLEPSLPGGRIKTGRKGVADYGLRVTGVPAHAGIEPDKGASAIHALMELLAQIRDAARPEDGTTVNVGRIEGGTALNVVAEHARAGVDVRFWTRDEAERVDRAVRRLRPSDARCTLDISGGINRYPLEETAESRAVVARAAACAAEMGFELQTGRTGGGSDGNFTSGVGCPTLDGLGPDGGGAHARHEHVLTADLPRRIEWVSRLLEAL